MVQCETVLGGIGSRCPMPRRACPSPNHPPTAPFGPRPRGSRPSRDVSLSSDLVSCHGGFSAQSYGKSKRRNDDGH